MKRPTLSLKGFRAGYRAYMEGRTAPSAWEQDRGPDYLRQWKQGWQAARRVDHCGRTATR